MSGAAQTARMVLRAPETRSPVPIRVPAPAVRAAQAAAAVRVSQPSEPAEREAERVARRVVAMPAAAAAPLARRFARVVPAAPSALPSALGVGTSLGQPLPRRLRRDLEPRFGADFSAVQVHTGEPAARASRRLNAAAFTVGREVFFGRGRFQPDSAPGRSLIAHELTHTIQQGGAAQPATVQRSVDTAVRERTLPRVQRLGIQDALDYFAEKAEWIPGFSMLALLLGFNPVSLRSVPRTAANLLRALIQLLPGGALITQALDNHGIVDRVAAWAEGQLSALGDIGSAIRASVDEFLDSLSWTDIFDLGGLWDRAKRIVTGPIDRIIAFGSGLVSGIIQFIKDAILRPIASLIEPTRGYPLLKAVLGFDPVTGDPVPHNATTLLGGFMTLIGQDEVWQNIQRGNAIAQAWAWFEGALAGLMGFVTQIPTVFLNAFRSLELVDIILVPRAFAKIIGVFAGFAGQFLSWGLGTVIKLLEIIFSVVAPGAMAYLRRAGGAIQSIFRNPIGFVMNLVRAAKAGLQRFAGNFFTHLQAGLIAWLTGSLPGIYIPRGFNLTEILKFALSVLGLSWANLRGKLVGAVGEPAVRAMETGFDLVVTLVRDGPAAAWEQLKESLANMKAMVIDGIVDMVTSFVVTKAIPKLVAMFIPGAGFITAIIAIYDTVMTFVAQLSRIAQVVTSFIDSMMAIASGNIGAAAARVEATLAGLLTLAINFLAGFAGLGKVADKVRAIIERIRAPIDKALDRVVAWIVNAARKLGRFITGPAGSAEAAAPANAPIADDRVLVPFAIGREKHSIRIASTNGRLTMQMSSELLMEFSDRVKRIRDEWIPLRRGHPAGNLEAELNALASDGEKLIIAANGKRSERKQSLAMNDAVSALAARLKAICQRFDIMRVEGITNFREPPEHAPTYAPPDSYGRARGMSATLSFRSRPHMRGTNSASVTIPGTQIAAYHKGHLLAASLGGSNTDPANYAPMSGPTNTSRGGIVLFEAALRMALRQDVFPPWIVHYGIRCVYTGSEEKLGNEVAKLVNSPVPGTVGNQLFLMGKNRTDINADTLKSGLPGANPVKVVTNAEAIRKLLLLSFTPRRFSVDVRIEQAPEGGTLPASSPFDNHM